MHFLLINSMTEHFWTQISIKNAQYTIYRFFKKQIIHSGVILSGIYSIIFTRIDSLFRTGVCISVFWHYGYTYTDGCHTDAMRRRARRMRRKIPHLPSWPSHFSRTRYNEYILVIYFLKLNQCSFLLPVQNLPVSTSNEAGLFYDIPIRNGIYQVPSSLILVTRYE